MQTWADGFDETAYWAWFETVQGMPYGYHRCAVSCRRHCDTCMPATGKLARALRRAHCRPPPLPPPCSMLLSFLDTGGADFANLPLPVTEPTVPSLLNLLQLLLPNTSAGAWLTRATPAPPSSVTASLCPLSLVFIGVAWRAQACPSTRCSRGASTTA